MITLAQVKTYTGIADASQDAEITAMIPVVEAAVRNITRNHFALQLTATLTDGSRAALISGVYTYYGQYIEDVQEYIEAGSQVTGRGIPSGTYIEYVYQDGASYYAILSAEATASGVVDMMLGLPVSLLPVLAKGVMWKISQTTTAPINAGWSHKTMGPLSVTLGDSNAAIDNASGMPAWFVSALPRYHGGH